MCVCVSVRDSGSAGDPGMPSSNQADLAGEQGRAIHFLSWLLFMFPLTKGPVRGPEGPACVHEEGAGDTGRNLGHMGPGASANRSSSYYATSFVSWRNLSYT